MTNPRQSNSGQWCALHGCHQDDPRHDYSYPECERHLRAATWRENLALAWAQLTRKGLDA